MMTDPATPREPTPEARHFYEAERLLADIKTTTDWVKITATALAERDRFAEQRVAAATAEADAGYDGLAKLLLTCKGRLAAAQKVIEAARKWQLEASEDAPEWSPSSYTPAEIALSEALAAYDAERGNPKNSDSTT